MQLPQKQQIKFFVFIIESPSALDIYHRRSEGEIIQKAIQLNEIPSAVKTAITSQAFEASIKIGLTEAMVQLPGYFPLLHISAHGSSQGIQLSNGEIVTWGSLKNLLIPINQALKGNLVVCMSSCEGYAGITMAMHIEDRDLPFLSLVGCAGKPSWAETAVAYTTFYHQLWNGKNISVAVNAMKVASDNELFFFEPAEQSRKKFLDYIDKVNTEKAIATLKQQLKHETPNHLDSLRKLI